MKKAVSILLLTSIALTLLFVIFSSSIQKAVDGFVCSYLTSRYGTHVEAEDVKLAGWGAVSFKSLKIGRAENNPPWLTAEDGFVFFSEFPRSLRRARLDVRRFSFGGAIRSKASVFIKLVSPKKIETASANGWPRFDSARFFISGQGNAVSVRIAKVVSNDFRVHGAIKFDHQQLQKINIRWSVPEAIYSKWPDLLLRKMVPEGQSWRGAGLSYGGQTWTLRGLHGPLLQFSGSLSANSH